MKQDMLKRFIARTSRFHKYRKILDRGPLATES